MTAADHAAEAKKLFALATNPQYSAALGGEPKSEILLAASVQAQLAVYEALNERA